MNLERARHPATPFPTDMSFESRAVVSVRREGAIAVVTIDNPPVNALALPVRIGVLEAFEEIAADPGVAAVVLA